MNLSCDVIPLWSITEQTKNEIASGLCWPGSDFHRKLSRTHLSDEDGVIALVRDQENRLIGWARSENWTDETGWEWPTLESFVRKEHRGLGLAAFATAGLVPGVFAEEGYGCAVFSPPMLLVAARAGLHPSLFERDRHGRWRRHGE